MAMVGVDYTSLLVDSLLKSLIAVVIIRLIMILSSSAVSPASP